MDISQNMVDRDVLLKMKKNLELPQNMKDIASGKPFNVIPVDEIDSMTHDICVIIKEQFIDKGASNDNNGVNKDLDRDRLNNESDDEVGRVIRV